jgi:hypothetical protein
MTFYSSAKTTASTRTNASVVAQLTEVGVTFGSGSSTNEVLRDIDLDLELVV